MRRIALALPEVEEYEHGHRPAFRVHGKRFATMLDEEGILAAAASWPEACEARHFAGRIAAVRVTYRALPEGVLPELLEEAWARKAPKRLLRL